MYMKEQAELVWKEQNKISEYVCAFEKWKTTQKYKLISELIESKRMVDERLANIPDYETDWIKGFNLHSEMIDIAKSYIE
jgi:DNA-directed RNA polymerase subunit F